MSLAVYTIEVLVFLNLLLPSTEKVQYLAILRDQIAGMVDIIFRDWIRCPSPFRLGERSSAEPRDKAGIQLSVMSAPRRINLVSCAHERLY